MYKLKFKEKITKKKKKKKRSIKKKKKMFKILNKYSRCRGMFKIKLRKNKNLVLSL